MTCKRWMWLMFSVLCACSGARQSLALEDGGQDASSPDAAELARDAGAELEAGALLPWQMTDADEDAAAAVDASAADAAADSGGNASADAGPALSSCKDTLAHGGCHCTLTSCACESACSNGPGIGDYVCCEAYPQLMPICRCEP